jgi:hypothetical protein
VIETGIIVVPFVMMILGIFEWSRRDESDEEVFTIWVKTNMTWGY